LVAGSDFLEKLNDVAVAHEDAPSADRLTDPVLVLGAMDIDVAVVGVDVASRIDSRFQSAEPEDPARDETGRRVVEFGDLREMMARRHPVLENDARGLSRADPFRDFMKPSGSPQGMGDIGRRPLGSRYDV
jgi:hypothetical protein